MIKKIIARVLFLALILSMFFVTPAICRERKMKELYDEEYCVFDGDPATFYCLKGEEISGPIYYGYYTYGQYRQAGTNIDDYLNKTLDYTNLAFIEASENIPTTAQLEKIKSKNAKLLLCLEHYIYSADDGDYNPYNENEERAKLQTLRNRIEDYLDVIYAIYPMDEPYWRGLSKEQLENKIDIIKEVFPEIPVFVNFDFGFVQPESRSLPNNLDIVSGHIYPLVNRGEDFYKGTMRYWIDVMKGLSGSRPIFVIPHSASSEWANWPAREPTPDQQKWAYEVLKEQGITGLLWWFYGTSMVAPEASFYGFLHHWNTLHAVHKEIGEKIKEFE